MPVYDDTDNQVPCPKCIYGSIVKNGNRKVFRKGVSKKVQAYLCKGCGHQWREKPDWNKKT